uniref:AMP-dependent synthetase/ligase domain-containing protein n=1 Tax=Biomphalaria glabrata TaxID=6526 RepID=A0A2C9JSA0_BIOGL
MQNARHSHVVSSQPPDVTNNAKSTRQADRVGRYNQSSVRMNASGNVTGMIDEDAPAHGKVSAKIQQLLNTLKRPKRKPLKEYFLDEEEATLETPSTDPNAPKPEGKELIPQQGDPLVIPSGLPRNLEGALQRYGSSTYKANAITVLDANGKPTYNLTYGKLLSRTQKIAYSLLCKVGQKGEPIRQGDRVGVILYISF